MNINTVKEYKLHKEYIVDRNLLGNGTLTLCNDYVARFLELMDSQDGSMKSDRNVSSNNASKEMSARGRKIMKKRDAYHFLTEHPDSKFQGVPVSEIKQELTYESAVKYLKVLQDA